MEHHQLVSAFLQFLPPECIIEDEETQKPYECDGQPGYCEMPLLVVLPGNIEQVRQIMRICHEMNVPVVARGAGTGLCAGAMPNRDGVLLSMSRFDKILDIDPQARLAKVQPGVTNLSISEAVARHNLYYGPDPSSQIACTIGGNIAENSGGVHCLKYGLTVHNLINVEIVTNEGELVSFGTDALDGPGLDLIALFTGSEGMLGVTVSATVKLLPKPELAQVVLAGFPSVSLAGDAVGRIIAEGIIPAGLEMMDELAIQAAEDYVKVGYPLEAKALLLCEVDGTQDEVVGQTNKVEKLFQELGASSIRVSKNEQERLALWQGRKAAFPAVGRISPDYYCMDGTIPRSQLSYVLGEISRLSTEYNLRVANVFHAGDGNLHPLILFDAGKTDEWKKTEEFGGKILELCVAAGGCITGEHGVGIEKLNQMPAQFSDQEIIQFTAIKKAFDPAGILNPGKGIPTLKHCQEYRVLERSQA